MIEWLHNSFTPFVIYYSDVFSGAMGLQTVANVLLARRYGPPIKVSSETELRVWFRWQRDQIFEPQWPHDVRLPPKRRRPHGGSGIERDLPSVFRGFQPRACGGLAPHNRRTLYRGTSPARVTDAAGGG